MHVQSSAEFVSPNPGYLCDDIKFDFRHHRLLFPYSFVFKFLWNVYVTNRQKATWI